MRAIATPDFTLEPQVAAHAEEMFPLLCDPALYEYENEPPPSVDWLRARHQVRRFSAVFKRENRRSMRLLERLGFTLAAPEEQVEHPIEPDEWLMELAPDARARSLAGPARRW